jgi:hypothetical protein
VEAQRADDATPAARWDTSHATALLQALPRLHVVDVEAFEVATVAMPAMVSQPTVLLRVTSAEVPTTMLVTVKHKP